MKMKFNPLLPSARYMTAPGADCETEHPSMASLRQRLRSEPANLAHALVAPGPEPKSIQNNGD